MSLKLYAPLGSWRAAKALIAAQYNGIHVEQPAFQMGRDNKTPEFLRMNPLGKVPVLETEQGSIFESNAIARYVARLRRDTGLYGQSFMESAQVDQWVDFAANEAEPVSCTLAYPIFGYMPFNEQAFAAAKEDCQKLFKLLDDYLLRRTFMVGNQITLADIVLATTLLNVFRLVADAQFRAPYTNLVRWYETCINQPEFVAVLGKPHLCTKSQAGASMAVAAAPAEDKKGKKEQKPKEEKKPKEQKPKEEKKPKEEAKKPAPKPKPADDDDEGSDEERKPKKPNALDLLPPTTMSMDAWKKVYSNTPDLRGDAMVQFWNMLDKSGYCLFHCSYQKAEGEGRVLYMTLNLVSGFLQRLDKLRKYAFGTMGVWGEEPELEIEGVWLFRGQEIPEDMKEHPSYEYHTWRQLSADNADDRKTVEDYWCADVEDKVNGKRCRENKCYK